MTNTLLASITGVTDGITAISSSDRNFYPEYGLAGFRAVTQSNYGLDFTGGTPNHLYNSEVYYSAMPGSFGRGITNGPFASPVSVFSQPSGAAFGNYANVIAFNY